MRKDSDHILKKRIGPFSSRHKGNLKNETKSDSQCYFCDENEDHIATNRPNNSKIVQYLACQKFTEMTPSERFQLLRKEGHCIQCLFLVPIKIKANSNGKCQKDFVCNHQSHSGRNYGRSSVMTNQISSLIEQSFPEICRNDQSLNEAIQSLKCDKLHVFDMVEGMKRKSLLIKYYVCT